MKKLQTNKWNGRNPTKDSTPAAPKGKKMGSKKRFTRQLPPPELEDILCGYRKA